MTTEEKIEEFRRYLAIYTLGKITPVSEKFNELFPQNHVKRLLELLEGVYAVTVETVESALDDLGLEIVEKAK